MEDPLNASTASTRVGVFWCILGKDPMCLGDVRPASRKNVLFHAVRGFRRIIASSRLYLAAPARISDGSGVTGAKRSRARACACSPLCRAPGGLSCVARREKRGEDVRRMSVGVGRGAVGGGEGVRHSSVHR